MTFIIIIIIVIIIIAFIHKDKNISNNQIIQEQAY